jgi:dolichol kinase
MKQKTDKTIMYVYIYVYTLIYTYTHIHISIHISMLSWGDGSTTKGDFLTQRLC